MPRLITVPLFTVLLALAALHFAPPIASQGNTITVNPSIQFQTMTGFEATAQIGHNFYQSKSLLWRDQAISMAVEMGVNRLRVELTSGIENPRDYYAEYQAGTVPIGTWNQNRYNIINDNSDSNVINPNGFKWSSLDHTIEFVVLPFCQKLATKGEKCYLNFNYADFEPSPFEHRNTPLEYAEFVLATYQHVKTKYGIVPDSWQVMLEPDNDTGWTTTHIGQCLAATGPRLVAAGFSPRFVAPSTTSGPAAKFWLNDIVLIPGAQQYLKEVSYHRYQNIDPIDLDRLRVRAKELGMDTAMLEWGPADHHTLHEDLKVGWNSAWQQYTLAFSAPSDAYLIVNDPTGTPSVTITPRAKFYRQYFKYIRRGAVRIDAVSNNPNFDFVAFRNVNGSVVSVGKAASGGSFTINGLPSGTYGIFYTTNTQYDVQLPDQTGSSVSTSIPATGVITIYGKGGTPAPSPSPVATPSSSPAPSPTTTPLTRTISTAATTVSPGSSVTVTWTAPTGHSVQDWIGLYKVGVPANPAPPKPQWEYLGAATSGSLNLTAPAAVGQYEFRYYLSNGYSLAVTSNQFTVATPSPTPTPRPSPSPIPSPSPQPTPIPSPSVSPTPCPPCPCPSPTVTPVPSPTVNPTPTPIPSPTIVPTPTPPLGQAFYAAVNGLPLGTGAFNNPWPLQTALSHPATLPCGATLYLRGGTYVGKFVSFLNCPSNPITVRSYPGEWAKLDGYVRTTLAKPLAAGCLPTNSTTVVLSADIGLSNGSTVMVGDTAATMEQFYLAGKQPDGVTWTDSGCGWSGTTPRAHAAGEPVWDGSPVLEIRGSNVIYRDFEILTSDPRRSFNFKLASGMASAVRGYGVFVSYPVRNVKLVNLNIHDNGGGIFLGVDADVEIYGNLIYNNGYNDHDRGHGLAVYAQNLGTFQKKVRANFAFNGFTGMKLYAESQQVRNFLVEYNILFNAGVLESFPGNTADNGLELSPSHRQSNFFAGTGNTAEPLVDLKIRKNYLFHVFDARPEGGNLGLGYQGRNSTGIEITDSRIMGGNNGVDLKHISGITMTGNKVYSQTTSLGNTFNFLVSAALETGFSGTVNNNQYFSQIPPIQGFTGYVFGLGINGVLKQACGGGGPLRFTDPCSGGQGGFREHTGWDANSTLVFGAPTQNEIFPIVNEYDPNRVHIAFYNWQNLPTVTINVPFNPGDKVEFYPAESGGLKVFQTVMVLSGRTITIPSSGWPVAAPIGMNWTPASVAPKFVAGIIKKVP